MDYKHTFFVHFHFTEASSSFFPLIESIKQNRKEDEIEIEIEWHI